MKLPRRNFLHLAAGAAALPAASRFASAQAYPSRPVRLIVGAPQKADSVPASIRIDAGVLDHLSPHAELDLDESPQLLGRAGKSLEADGFELGLDVRAVDDVAQRAGEFRHDRRRRSGRGDEAGPRSELEARV